MFKGERDEIKERCARAAEDYGIRVPAARLFSEQIAIAIRRLNK